MKNIIHTSENTHKKSGLIFKSQRFLIKPDSKGLVFITFVDNCRERSLVITWFLFRFHLRTATEDCNPNQGFCFDFHFSQVLFMNFLQLNNPTYDIQIDLQTSLSIVSIKLQNVYRVQQRNLLAPYDLASCFFFFSSVLFPSSTF